MTKDDGTVTEEMYTVCVPRMETRERTYVASVPSDSARFDVAIDKISALDLGGNAIDGTALAARLHKPAYVLAMQGDATSYKPIDPFYLNVLRPETMVIFLPPGTIPAPAAQQSPVPVPRPVR